VVNSANRQRERRVARPRIFALDAERLITELAPISPAIRSSETAIEILRTNRAIHISNFLPNFVFSYQFQQSFTKDIVDEISGFGDSNNWVTGGGFTIAIAIPLGNLLPFSQNWVEYYNNERELQKAELTLQENMQNLAIEMYSLVDGLNQLAASISAKALNIRLAERAFAVAQEGYTSGLRNILEVRDAQNQLETARLDYATERFNYIVAQINLMTQLGIDIDILERYQ